MRSMLTLAEAFAKLPAKSAALPFTFWSFPSEVTVNGALQDCTPERLSVQAKLTMTGELFQPDGLGGGAWVAETVGGVLSMLI